YYLQCYALSISPLSYKSYPAHPVLNSFPTRRSSDLPHGLLSARSTIFVLAWRGKSREHSPPGLPFPIAWLPTPATTREVPILWGDRKSTRLNSSHVKISYAVFCLKKKTKT